MTADLLGDEGPPPRRHARLLAAALVLLVGGGWAAESVLTHRGSTELRRCVRVTEADLADLSRRAAALESYVAPQLSSPAVSEAVRASLAQIVQGSVAHDLPRTERDRSRCAQVPVLPWRQEVARARKAYLSWLDLRIRDLSAATRDVNALHEPGPGLAQGRRTAVAALARQGIVISP